MKTISHDSPATEDLLARKKFARQITNSLFSSLEKKEESLVIGICGEWGSAPKMDDLFN